MLLIDHVWAGDINVIRSLSHLVLPSPFSACVSDGKQRPYKSWLIKIREPGTRGQQTIWSVVFPLQLGKWDSTAWWLVQVTSTRPKKSFRRSECKEIGTRKMPALLGYIFLKKSIKNAIDLNTTVFPFWKSMIRIPNLVWNYPRILKLTINRRMHYISHATNKFRKSGKVANVKGREYPTRVFKMFTVMWMKNFESLGTCVFQGKRLDE